MLRNSVMYLIDLRTVSDTIGPACKKQCPFCFIDMDLNIEIAVFSWCHQAGVLSKCTLISCGFYQCRLEKVHFHHSLVKLELFN